MLPNNVLIAQRRKLNTVYVNVISESEADKNTYRDAIDNLIELTEVTAAESMLLEAENSWKDDEEFILLKLKLYYKTKNSWAMKKKFSLLKNRECIFPESTGCHRVTGVILKDSSLSGGEAMKRKRLIMMYVSIGLLVVLAIVVMLERMGIQAEDTETDFTYMPHSVISTKKVRKN
ncbi:MAG: hypothetical protein U5K84_09245 [Alkalibacterium sp.]|nr:hypothetical protein [Alkalibacterium sp.]